MIRIRPYEWLHMEVSGSGYVGREKVSGTLYITPHRVTIQGSKGPAWSAPIKTLEVSSRGNTGIMTTPDGHKVEWKSKKTPVAWWGNAIRFWKAGVIPTPPKADGPPPTFSSIEELPDIMSQSNWNIRWYNRETLAECGIPGKMPDGEEFDRIARRTNIILAALLHDGFPDGPPPAYYRMALRRHALTDITHTVWAWREGLRYITSVMAGKNSPKAYNNYKRYAGRPDKWYEPKPIAPMKTEWHHEINPASSGGHPYAIRERCRAMIPIVSQVADDLHENPTHNPYLRMRQVFEAVRDGKQLPVPPREALPLARNAAGNPW